MTKRAAVGGCRRPELQVRLGEPPTALGPPVGQHRGCGEVVDPAGAGQLIDIGGDTIQDRGHPGQADHHQRPVRMIAVGTQVDRRGILASVQAGQPAGALPQPARLIDEPVRVPLLDMPTETALRTGCLDAFTPVGTRGEIEANVLATIVAAVLAAMVLIFQR